MKSLRNGFCFLFVLLASPVFAGNPSAVPATEEIVRKANHMALYQGTDVKGTVRMLITDKLGRKRKRVFHMLRKDNGESSNDQKYFVFFQTPADVRKMVFLVHKHAAQSQDDDRWLYMPSLDLVKRIAASDKRTSFVGSDFLYEDISGRNIHEDIHELLERTDRYYVLKSVPKHPEKVEFDHYITFIDMQTFLPVKMKFFKPGERLYRTIENQQIESVTAKINGEEVVYPTVTRAVARNLETGSSTEMTFEKIQYNLGLEDALFTERYLRRPPREAMR